LPGSANNIGALVTLLQIYPANHLLQVPRHVSSSCVQPQRALHRPCCWRPRPQRLRQPPQVAIHVVRYSLPPRPQTRSHTPLTLHILCSGSPPHRHACGRNHSDTYSQTRMGLPRCIRRSPQDPRRAGRVLRTRGGRSVGWKGGVSLELAVGITGGHVTGKSQGARSSSSWFHFCISNRVLALGALLRGV
jgi:hypothetical protein